MNKWIVGGLAAVALSGCATLDPNVATPNQVVVAVNAYNAAVVTGKNYLKLPLCGKPPCRTQALSQAVYTSLRAGRAARATLLADLANNQTASITAVQALQSAYAVLQQIPAN